MLLMFLQQFGDLRHDCVGVGWAGRGLTPLRPPQPHLIVLAGMDGGVSLEHRTAFDRAKN